MAAQTQQVWAVFLEGGSAVVVQSSWVTLVRRLGFRICPF